MTKITQYLRRIGRKIVDSGMPKSLLMTFLGTTMSICLTFGTTTCNNKRQRDADRRMSALMVLSNIESFAQELESRADTEDANDTIATWLLNLPEDSLDLLPSKEMMALLSKVVGAPTINHDRTSENIFSNNIETWKNMGNFAFIDNVGQCFSRMNEYEDQWNKWTLGFMQSVRDIQKESAEYEGQQVHTRILRNNGVRESLRLVGSWRYQLRYLAAWFRFQNKQNMALIGLTEQEVLDFTEERTKDLELHQEEEPLQADFFKSRPNPDSLTTLKQQTLWADSILRMDN